MKQTYEIKTPTQLVFGDPMYFEQFQGKRLEELVVNLSPPKNFAAKVVLDEFPLEDYPEFKARTMSIFLAPAAEIDTYLKDMMYGNQVETVRPLGVDTAQYYLQVDDRGDTFHTGGDGCWGEYREYSRGHGSKRVLDAAVLTVCMPDDFTFSETQTLLYEFFEDVHRVPNVEPLQAGPTLRM